jgi:glycosyltransferase involved in cell wall biosynthesis
LKRDHKPLLSILIPSYNRVEELGRAIRSIGPNLEQIEIVVVDDGSSLPLYEQIAALSAEHPHLKLFRNETNLGMTKNWNVCLSRARGLWVGLLCCDDEFEEGAIGRIKDILEKRTSPCLIMHQPDLTSEYVEVPAGRETVHSLLLPLASGNFWHRDIVDVVGGFDERFTYSPDGEYWFRIASRFPVIKVRKPLARYNQHDGNYMWRTWEEADFLTQTELLLRTTLKYKLSDPDMSNPVVVSGELRDGLWGTLIYILRTARARGGKRYLFWKYYPIAWRYADSIVRKRALVKVVLGF